MSEPLTREKILEACSKLFQNGLDKGAVIDGLNFEGVPYWRCSICSEGKGYSIHHPVGVSHEECV